MARELDHEEHWLRCGEGDIACDVCERSPAGTQPNEVLEHAGQANIDRRREKLNGGLIRHRRAQMMEQQEIDEYIWRLSQVRDGCMLCRVLMPGKDWRHRLDQCGQAHKHVYMSCKKRAVAHAKGWMAAYSACFRCGQPQSVCDGWSRKSSQHRGDCKYADLVMLLAWAQWMAGGREREHVEGALEVPARTADEALLAAGRASTLGGERCVVGVRILADSLRRWEGAETARQDRSPSFSPIF